MDKIFKIVVNAIVYFAVIVAVITIVNMMAHKYILVDALRKFDSGEYMLFAGVAIIAAMIQYARKGAYRKKIKK